MTEGKRRARSRDRDDASGRAATGSPSQPEGGGRKERVGERSPEPLHIPTWLPPVLYGLLTLWIFRAFVFSDDMLYGGDTLSLGYMARKFYADALRSGVFPLWNPLLLGGTPFLESLAGGDSLYPTSLLLLVMEPYRALGWKLVLHVFLAGLFMFGWTRVLGCSRPAALLAGIAYGCAPFLISLVHPGHDGKIFVTTLAPLLFWASERTFLRPGPLPYVGVAGVVALVLFTTHFQMAYFLFGGVGVYYLFRVIQVWRGEASVAGSPRGADSAPTPVRYPRAAFTHLALFLTAALAGAAAAGVQLIPAVTYVVEYSRRTATTVRADVADNVAYSSSFSLHPEELVSYVIPEFAGNNAGGAAWATKTYWGQNFFRDNHGYAGLVVLLLAGLSFFGAPRKGLRLFIAGLGTVALLFALGRHTPVWRIFYELLPGIRLFRAPDQASFLFGFAAISLAAFGVDRAISFVGKGDASEVKGMRYLWIASGGVLLLTLLVASGALFSFWMSVLRPMCGVQNPADCAPGTIHPLQVAALEAARPFIARGALIATALAAATAAVVWAGTRGMLKPLGVTLVLGLLVTLDALRVDVAFVQTIPFQSFAASDAGIDYLVSRQREVEPFRVAPVDPGDAQRVGPAMFGLELATGHHPNDLARYRELIGMRGSGHAENLMTGASLEGDSVAARLQPGPVLRLLGVRYLLVPGLLQGLEPVDETRLDGTPQAIYEVEVLPRARLVGNAEVVPDDQAVARILDPTFDPESTAILAEPAPIDLPGGPVTGTVTWIERGLNEMSLRVVSDRPALLVIADNWFPSWRARVDGGEELSVLRAYHTLRAVPVGAGEHTVELYYRSPLLARSLLLTLATVALLLGVTAVSLLRNRRRGAAGAEG